MPESNSDIAKSDIQDDPGTGNDSQAEHKNRKPSNDESTNSQQRNMTILLLENKRRAAVSIAVLALAVVMSYACAWYGDELRNELRVVVGKYVLFWRPAPPGHGLPLGSHQPPIQEPIDVLDQFPHPSVFFNQYTKPRRPALFRGLAKLQPAYHRWTDDYLREQFGDMEVQVEEGKKQDSGVSDTSMNFSRFLSEYKKKEYYLVHSAPEELQSDLALPRSAQCGGLQRLLFAVMIWFSSGGTRSIFHYDELDNIICVLDGHKQILVVNQDDAAKHLEFDRMVELYSSVDVESVDMYRFPGIHAMPWYNVTVKKGDCFYLPYKWPHYVRSSDSRNVAVNMWFARMVWLNETDCAGKQLPDAISMSDMDPHESVFMYQSDLISQAAGYTQLTLEVFSKLYANLLPEEADAAEDVFDELDVDGDGVLSVPEMYSHDPARFMRFFPRFDSDK